MLFQRKSKIALKVELSVKCKQILPPTKTVSTGERLNWLLIKLKVDKPSPASRVLIWLKTSSAHSSKKEKLLLRQSKTSEQLMDMSWESSLLHSPENQVTKLEKPTMPYLPNKKLSEKESTTSLPNKLENPMLPKS
mgnify:CR=1 FL=1